jgi:hypothetical protein
MSTSLSTRLCDYHRSVQPRTVLNVMRKLGGPVKQNISAWHQIRNFNISHTFPVSHAMQTDWRNSAAYCIKSSTTHINSALTAQYINPFSRTY